MSTEIPITPDQPGSIFAEVERRIAASIPGLGYALAPTRDGMLLKVHVSERGIAVLLLPKICAIATALAPVQSIQIGTDQPIHTKGILKIWSEG